MFFSMAKNLRTKTHNQGDIFQVVRYIKLYFVKKFLPFAADFEELRMRFPTAGSAQNRTTTIAHPGAVRLNELSRVRQNKK